MRASAATVLSLLLTLACGSAVFAGVIYAEHQGLIPHRSGKSYLLLAVLPTLLPLSYVFYRTVYGYTKALPR